MCGTMQTAAERIEAAAYDPAWGQWLKDLEAEALQRHGFGWGERAPIIKKPSKTDDFQPMCVGCGKSATPAAQREG